MSDNFEELFEAAYQLHIDEKFDEAKIAYEKLLEINPEDINVLNLYAQLNFLLKNYDKALILFNKVYQKIQTNDIAVNIIKLYLIKNDFENAIKTAQAITVKNADILRLEAKGYISIKNYEKAIEAYQNIIALSQNSDDDIFNLALLYSYNNDINSSLKYALEYYQNNKDDVSICFHLSSLYEKKNDIQKQLEYLMKAVEIKPDIELFYNIGVLYRLLGSEDEALKYFNKVIKLNSNHRLAFMNIARIYQTRDRKIALSIYEKLAEKFPDDLMILSQLYISYKELFQNEAAYKIALKLIEIDSKQSYPYVYAADALAALGLYNQAISMYEASQKYSDNNEYSDTMIADIYSCLNQGDKAIQIFKTKYPHLTKESKNYCYIQMCEKNLQEVKEVMHKAILKPRSEEDLDNRALQYFHKLNIDKKFNINENVFKQFKTNKTQKEIETFKYYAKKDLYSNNPENKTILVYNANGTGDMIMFSRYLFILEKYTKKIILQVPKSMLRLMKYNFPNFKVISDEEIIKENLYDYTSSFFGLLFNLKETDLKNIPYSSKYISVDENLIKEKDSYAFLNTKKKKVGIYWLGNPVIMPQRSIKPNKLKPLFDIEEIQIYSFQIGNLDYESENMAKELSFIDLAPYIKDYADTAAFLKKIDILVTIDTSIANLAGAMGIKTFLMLPFESEWRWFHDTKTTPWYDSVKIFKQKTPFDWEEVVERIKNELTV